MASRTERQHRDANKTLYRCLILGVMSTDAGQGFPAELKLQASYMTLTCEYHSAPADWTGRAKLADSIRQKYTALRQVNPNIPDPQLGELRVRRAPPRPAA